MDTTREETGFPSGTLAGIEAVAVGMVLSSVAGGGALSLSVLGLAGVSRHHMALISILCAGCALLFSGATVASRYPRLMQGTGVEGLGDIKLWGGLAAELSGGIAGIVFGILGLVGASPLAFSALAVLVFGAALIAGSEAALRLGGYAFRLTGAPPDSRAVASEAVKAAAGVRIIVGSVATALGVIVLTGFRPETLPLVALIFIGFSILVSGTMISARMLMLLH